MEKKTRNTAAKQEILQLVTNSSSALSQQDIQHQLNNLCDRVTTYRVLARLVKEEKIHKIVNTDGVIKYAACHTCNHHNHENHHNHIHFSCSVCKSVTCLENVIPSFTLPADYSIEDINFTIGGVCPTCK